MSANEIIENNKLIAEFMGINPNNGGEYEMYGTIESIEDEPTSKHYYFASEMLFHIDWNWIMSAVTKALEVMNFSFEGRDDLLDDMTSAFHNVSITELYEALIKAINWYNQQQPK